MRLLLLTMHLVYLDDNIAILTMLLSLLVLMLMMIAELVLVMMVRMVMVSVIFLCYSKWWWWRRWWCSSEMEIRINQLLFDLLCCVFQERSHTGVPSVTRDSVSPPILSRTRENTQATRLSRAARAAWHSRGRLNCGSTGKVPRARPRPFSCGIKHHVERNKLWACENVLWFNRALYQHWLGHENLEQIKYFLYYQQVLFYFIYR